MALKDSETRRVIDFVKSEPRTVQDVSGLIGRSWVTTDSYLKEIRERTGLIEIKTFRKGTPGALKVVFYSNPDSLSSGELREFLFSQIKAGRAKEDFDFMDVFQYVGPEKKRAFSLESASDPAADSNMLAPLLMRARQQVYCFSGNLSFVNSVEKRRKVIDLIEEMVRRKVRLRILARINLASIKNIEALLALSARHPGMVEVKHCYQPLRGLIIDDSIGRFKNEEAVSRYRKGELDKNTKTIYEIYDGEWVGWLQKVFWHLFRSSIDADQRLRELEKIF